MSKAIAMVGISPESEIARLEALRATGLLDSAPEQEFDELAQLAAAICGAPISIISLVDENRQWFKSHVGVDATETPRDVAFCAHAIQQDELFVVHDALEDERFFENRLVLGDPHVRFYAGFPLSTNTGEKLGTLCVIDRVPRKLTEGQAHALEVLARQVMSQIQLKGQVTALDAAARQTDLLTRKLSASNACFRGVMDASPAAAFIKDQTGRMIYCNQALTARHGAEPEHWLGKNDREIWPPDVAERARNGDLEVMAGHETLSFEETLTGLDGESISWNVFKFPFSNAHGERFVAAMALDVTKEREAERALRRYQEELSELNLKLRHLSLSDGLTLISNRRGLEDSLDREFHRARRSSSALSMLMLDVDHFKQFNDTHGHVAGDQVLQRIATLMTEHTRRRDTVARHGAEEFIAVLPDTEAAEALFIAERLCRFIAAYSWKHRQITVSVGVGTLEEDTPDPSAFVNIIDKALYQAKNSGRNQVCVAEPTQLSEPPRSQQELVL